MTMISYAQNAEDVRLRRAFGSQPTGFYVDVGAYDPESCSLTKHFYDRGWHGLNIEPSSPSFERVQRARPRDINIHAGASTARGTLTFFEFSSDADGLNTFSAEVAGKHRRAGFSCVERSVDVFPIADLLEKHAPAVIDFMNVDVEGFEREVLAGADLMRFRPRVLVIESTLPLSAIPSHEAWQELVLAADYRLAVFDGLNRFYVRPEDEALIELLAVPPSTLDDFVPYRLESEFSQPSRNQTALESIDHCWLVRGALRLGSMIRRSFTRVTSGAPGRGKT